MGSPRRGPGRDRRPQVSARGGGGAKWGGVGRGALRNSGGPRAAVPGSKGGRAHHRPRPLPPGPPPPPPPPPQPPSQSQPHCHFQPPRSSHRWQQHRASLARVVAPPFTAALPDALPLASRCLLGLPLVSTSPPSSSSSVEGSNPARDLRSKDLRSGSGRWPAQCLLGVVVHSSPAMRQGSAFGDGSTFSMMSPERTIIMSPSNSQPYTLALNLQFIFLRSYSTG